MAAVQVSAMITLIGGCMTHGAKGKVYVEWKWLIGPFP